MSGYPSLHSGHGASGIDIISGWEVEGAKPADPDQFIPIEAYQKLINSPDHPS